MVSLFRLLLILAGVGFSSVYFSSFVDCIINYSIKKNHQSIAWVHVLVGLIFAESIGQE